MCKISIVSINKDTLDISHNTNQLEILIDNHIYEYKTYVSEILKINKYTSAMYEDILNLYNKILDITKLNISMINGGENKP